MKEPAFAPRLADRNVRLFYAYGFLSNAGLWLGVWIKYLLDERGFELRYVLLMDLPFWLLVALLQAPTGALADHIGRRRVMAISGIAYTFTILGFGLTTNYWMLFADYVLWAVALATQSGADQALVFDSLEQSGQAARFQQVVGRGFAINLVAMLLGVTLGGVVGEWTTLAFTVQISTLFPLLATLCALAMAEPPREHVARHYVRDIATAVRFAWGRPQLRYTLLVGSLLLTGTFGPVVLIQPFLIHHDVETALFGVFQAPIRLISVAVAVGAAWIALRAGRGRILAGASLAIGGSYVALAAIDHLAAFAFFALPAIAAGLTNPLISAHLNERIPSARRATVLSLMQLLFALQVMLVEPALGFFTDEASLRIAFAFAAAYFGLLMPPLLLLWLRASRRPGELVAGDANIEAVGATG
jgi:MFS family permease